jgi:pyrroloquinoline quinone biosynthesis protein D|tara:strand:- start:1004 stop:1291 length:288 start_codon:yes stop_codon:yes gene_type:complete
MTNISGNTSVKISRQFRFQWEEAQQGFVLLYPEGMIQLSPSAGEILSRCQQQTTVADIIRDLQTTFAEADPDELANDVMEFIHEANDQGWLDINF